MKRLEELAQEYSLPCGSSARLATLLELVAVERSSITAVREPERAADVHVADSLSALVISELRSASRIADLGSGGGFPGLVLALAMPRAFVALVESVGRKCEFIRRAADAVELGNVGVVGSRAEQWTAGLCSQDVVTARALAPLSVLAEYAAPLLRMNGVLIAYKGRRDRAEELAGARACEQLGLGVQTVVEVSPFAGSGSRNLHVYEKVAPTPSGFPRRAGMARKHPLGAD